MSVICPRCSRPAVFHSTSSHIYGRDFGSVWDCRPCDAYVGCHPDGSPKGTLANKATRDARRTAHRVFDKLWQDWRLAYPELRRPGAHIVQVMRVRAYQWLAHHMGLKFDDTHIAMFDVAQCDRVVQLIAQHQPTAATVRAWAKQQRSEVTQE